MKTHSDVDPLRMIRLYRQDAGLTKSRLARDSGLHPNALRNMDEPGWNPNWSTIQKLTAIIPEGWTPEQEDAR